jgi:hypothetical protein
MHWLETITEIRAVKLELARKNPRGGMPIMPPAGASEGAIATVEKRIGRRLPPSYRAFLRAHDGWPELYQGASLLGARHLSRGTYVDLARMVLDECETPLPEMTPATRRGQTAPLIPFGIDAGAEAVFAWNPAEARDDDELEVVVWLNELGIRLASFPEFLILVLEMLSADLDARASSPGACALPPPRAHRRKVADLMYYE